MILSTRRSQSKVFMCYSQSRVWIHPLHMWKYKEGWKSPNIMEKITQLLT